MLREHCPVSLTLSLAVCALPVVVQAAAPEPTPVTPASVLPASQTLSVADCTPCSFTVGQAIASYDIRFNLATVPDGKMIKELKLSPHQAGSQQTLTVHDMAPVKPSESFFLGASDINFDGFNDLYIVTSRGVANTYADYWLFIPSDKTFSYLGNYPFFSVNRDKKRLSTYERGGFGGMVYEKTDYAFIDGRLTAVASEKQESTEREGVFRKKLYQRKAGQLRLTKTEIVKAPTAK